MRHNGSIRGRRSGRRLSVALIVALLCLVLPACERSASATPRATAPASSAPTPTATTLPTPLPTPTSALTVIQGSGPPVSGAAVTWRHTNLPSGFGMRFDVTDLHVAASDGATAYSCGPSDGTGKTQVIVTHDRGASWARVADAPSGGDGCQSIVVDALNPAIIVCCWSAGASPQAISTDGGASWHLGDGTYVVLWLATAGTRTYAILGYETTSGGAERLAESDDGLRTWRLIDGAFNSGGYPENLGKLWVNPANGALLLGGIFAPLWSSPDGGQHWSQVTLPVRGITDLAVQQPTAAQPWHICVSYYATPDDTAEAIACTRDGSATWTQEPPITPGNTIGLHELVGTPADGSLLVASFGKVYRLPAGTTRWQDLGPIPADSNGGVAYATAAPGTGSGSLWTFPIESDGAGGADPANAVYSAPYPH